MQTALQLHERGHPSPCGLRLGQERLEVLLHRSIQRRLLRSPTLVGTPGPGRRGDGEQDGLRTPVGHGIGLEAVEPPDLRPDETATLQVGEVLSIEVAYQLTGHGGFLARDTVLVTAGGARVLNRSARGLVELD